MNMPMIVSNIPANREVLKKHALYVNPSNIKEITEQFLYLISNYSQEVYKLHMLKENSYFETISSAQNRFIAYKNILTTMINELSQ